MIFSKNSLSLSFSSSSSSSSSSSFSSSSDGGGDDDDDDDDAGGGLSLSFDSFCAFVRVCVKKRDFPLSLSSP